MEIEKPRPSCRPSLDYNEGKVLRGVAELIAYANMESTAREDVYALFERYERSRYYVAEKSFHASVNPSPDDACGEEQILGFISALMGRLGYGKQPYLVYRHFDIEREHYHIVSVRTDRDGRKINNWYERRKASAFMAEAARQYGFSVYGKGEHVRERKDMARGHAAERTSRFDPRKEVLSQMRDIFRTALSYDHESFAQLSCILEHFGIRADLVQTGASPEITLQGTDRRGAPVTDVFPESSLGEPLYGKANEVWSACRGANRRRSRERERVRSLVGFAFGISRSEGHFSNILNNKGVSVHLSRMEGTGDVFGVTFVDHSTRTVFKASELGGAFSVRMMAEAVESGKWRREERGRGRSSYVKSSREAAREDALRLRDLHVGAVARVLRPTGQPRGNSWSGRASQDESRRKARRDAGRSGSVGATFEDRRFDEKIK